jgi:hypothetical protein
LFIFSHAVRREREQFIKLIFCLQLRKSRKHKLHARAQAISFIVFLAGEAFKACSEAQAQAAKETNSTINQY